MPNQNHAVVVTGASSGIGKAVAGVLKNMYGTCFNLDINNGGHDGVRFIKTDVSDIDDVSAAVNVFIQSEKKLKSLILCAGIGIHEKLTEGDPIKWKQVINVNLLGPLNVLRAFIPFMNEGGDIIFVTSVAAGHPYEYGGVYVATKTALNAIAETLRLETEDNIRVSVVEPGLVKTDFLKNTISGDRSDENISFDAISPQSVAEAVKYIIEQPNNIALNKLVIRPFNQKF